MTIHKFYLSVDAAFRFVFFLWVFFAQLQSSDSKNLTHFIQTAKSQENPKHQVFSENPERKDRTTSGKDRQTNFLTEVRKIFVDKFVRNSQ